MVNLSNEEIETNKNFYRYSMKYIKLGKITSSSNDKTTGLILLQKVVDGTYHIKSKHDMKRYNLINN